MTGRSRSYKESLLRRLKDNSEAVNYLQAALEDSQSAFLVALKNVLDSRKVAVVARASKLNRVHIHQMLTEDGNPTLNSLEKILRAIGLRLEIGLDNPKRRTVRASLGHKRRLGAHVTPKSTMRKSSNSPRPKVTGIHAAVLAGEQSGVAEGDVMAEIRERMRRRALATGRA
jgi:probable addiction module antidote protein